MALFLQKVKAQKITFDRGPDYRLLCQLEIQKGEIMINKKFLALSATVMLLACKQTDAADLVLYFMPGCPHCHNAIEFIDAELSGVSVEKIDITKGGSNTDKFNAALKKCGLESRGVPLMIVKGQCLQGYGPERGAEIKKILGK
jgi:glutaredoxin